MVLSNGPVPYTDNLTPPRGPLGGLGLDLGQAVTDPGLPPTTTTRHRRRQLITALVPEQRVLGGISLRRRTHDLLDLGL
jgi:hypothetical protein